MEAALCKMQLCVLAVRHSFLSQLLFSCHLQLKKLSVDANRQGLHRVNAAAMKRERKGTHAAALRTLALCLPSAASFLSAAAQTDGSHCRTFKKNHQTLQIPENHFWKKKQYIRLRCAIIFTHCIRFLPFLVGGVLFHEKWNSGVLLYFVWQSSYKAAFCILLVQCLLCSEIFTVEWQEPVPAT